MGVRSKAMQFSSEYKLGPWFDHEGASMATRTAGELAVQLAGIVIETGVENCPEDIRQTIMDNLDSERIHMGNYVVQETLPTLPNVLWFVTARTDRRNLELAMERYEMVENLIQHLASD